ncbi:TraB/VirB10 family protein [Sphingomonas sp. SUN039]|uniref:TraB/VirB10 family protein n=1 Tax=Sphingomonas sp. SUN039 TaxID=2937787 RepID=UPI00216472EE|nr:TraB/VirB10 family protein [Sphingomonas sp. SUN039]UVO53800.1 TraB/VirB10 family protein [Sphingomonas sp. SUN039]
MTLIDRLRKPRPEAATAVGDDASVSPIGEAMSGNESVRRKQQLLLGGVAGAALLGASFWIFSGGTTPDSPAAANGKEIKVATGDLVNRNMSEQEWMARSENRFASTDNRLRAVDGQAAQLAAMQKEMDALRGANSAMSTDGQRVLSAYQTENEGLKSQLAAAQNAPPVQVPGPTALYGPGSPALYQTAGGTGGGAVGAAGPSPLPREVKTVSFATSGQGGGNATRAERGTTVFSDSPDYLPANSFATARVIVGVDASAGVSSQTDPLPVVLRITGPARSVADNGRVLTTRIQGCLINGAARGDLSSEKVYVKLQRMTCAQPGGRYAVSEVKGFIAFAGKSGVRGRVVSREGGLITQAFLAGLAGGFGRGFSANTQSLLQGTNVSVNGKRQQLGAGDILQGGLGEGVSTAADTVSKYLIERAEQYQPVIEMPTGIDVEIVFLDGAFVRN